VSISALLEKCQVEFKVKAIVRIVENAWEKKRKLLMLKDLVSSSVNENDHSMCNKLKIEKLAKLQ
jgi:hypothetical protein